MQKIILNLLKIIAPPIKNSISTSPEREDTILLDESF